MPVEFTSGRFIITLQETVIQKYTTDAIANSYAFFGGMAQNASKVFITSQYDARKIKFLNNYSKIFFN